MPIKTHTFNETFYKIEELDTIEGVTDVNGPVEILICTILTGKNFRAFSSAFHEALEASGFCNECMHDELGNSRTEDAARFVWRWLKDRKIRK